MIIVKILLLILILLVLPWCIGFLFRKDCDGGLMVPVYGYLFSWAVSFAVCVYMILQHRTLTRFVQVDGCILLPAALVGVIVFFVRKKVTSKEKVFLSKSEFIYLALFLGLVLFQLYKTVFYSYADGDDAYYVATASIAEASDEMYVLDTYQGIAGSVNYRYALAPFPMWVAGIARASGVSVAALSHSILAPILIVITYIIYNEISKLLFSNSREKRYMFLTLVAAYEMFSNVSTATAGTFLLTRSRQGKEALANIVIPFLFLIVFRIIKSDCKTTEKDRILLWLGCMTAGFTSLFGNVIAPLMVLFLMIYSLVKKQGVINTLRYAVAVIPNILVVLIYVVKGATL